MSQVIRRIVFFAGLGLGGVAGFYSVSPLLRLGNLEFGGSQFLGVVIFGTALGSLLGALIGPRLGAAGWQLVSWAEGRLQRASFQDIVSGALGLVIGLIIANLLSPALTRIPAIGSYLSTAVMLLFGYLGAAVLTRKKDDLAGLIGLVKSGSRGERASVGAGTAVQPKILDTSVIIDGRIADICKTGFIEGPIVIPGFVLEELRHIADSSDVLKRNRGRRGLEVLNRIQKELDVQVQIYEKDIGGMSEVDSKLVKLARILGGRIITNDFNLNKVAELQGVRVLNINELANSVKPVVLPGEEMTVHVIKDGKEAGQGVAYLDDGTMIVIDGGKRHIGETIGVMVTSVLQTAAGRMIFAKPKYPYERAVQ
ncbi:MAG: PIN/TRAM domain-containing protein [Firmicutes bacterium]|nr:PIN/TRAM domain-containing protein [Bacillota bacterium]